MKFAEIDQRYLERRREISAEYGPREMWSMVDHWPLYCGIANLGRFMAISDLLRGTLDVPGHVAEFGAWRGANTLFLAKLLKIYDPHGSKLVHCFDSFEGLTTITAEDGAAASNARGSYKGSLQEMKDMIDLCCLTDDVVIHKGLIQDTLPALLEGQPEVTFSFIYCDTDLFEPTELILDRLHDHLAKGGLVVFDEWNDDRWPGETRAANAFARRHDAYEMIHVRSARQPTLVLKKNRL